MEQFGQVLAETVNLMQLEFTLYGFTFSWWQVFLWSTCAAIVLWVLFTLWGGR